MTIQTCSKCNIPLTIDNIADYADNMQEEADKAADDQMMLAIHKAIFEGHLFCSECYEEEYYELKHRQAIQRYLENKVFHLTSKPTDIPF